MTNSTSWSGPSHSIEHHPYDAEWRVTDPNRAARVAQRIRQAMQNVTFGPVWGIYQHNWQDHSRTLTN